MLTALKPLKLWAYCPEWSEAERGQWASLWGRKIQSKMSDGTKSTFFGTGRGQPALRLRRNGTNMVRPLSEMKRCGRSNYTAIFFNVSICSVKDASVVSINPKTPPKLVEHASQ
jgi:hypothetical protein